MTILLMAASRRPGSYNQQVIAQAEAMLQQEGHSTQRLDYADASPPIFGDVPVTPDISLPQEAMQFVEHLRAAEGLVLSTPEYNWSVPGHLKNLIDWVSCLRPYPFMQKPVLLLSATPSRRGGLLALTHLQMVLGALGARVKPQFFSLVQAHAAFDAHGQFTNPALREELENLLKAFSQEMRARG